jgi:GNAT superfamily N-acetyltransferase
VDDQPVWSIVCFFINRKHRSQGVAKALLRGALAHAGKHGAKIVEAYPIDPSARAAASSLYTGVASMFREAGFVEVARRSGNRPIVRYNLG